MKSRVSRVRFWENRNFLPPFAKLGLGEGAGGTDLLEVWKGAGFSVGVNSLFSGEAHITQTFTGTSGTSFGTNSYPTNTLDTAETYPFAKGINVPATNKIYFFEAPDISCQGNTFDHNKFIDYIRFTPSGRPGPNITVTLGVVIWHNDGDTSLATIPETNNQDYLPFPSSSDHFFKGNYYSPLGADQGGAGFDSQTDANTPATWETIWN